MKQHLSKIFPKFFGKKLQDQTDRGSTISTNNSQFSRGSLSTSRLELIDCRTARIFLLNKSEIEITVKNSIKAFQLIDNVCKHQNIVCSEYFGLKYKDGVHWKWLDENKSLKGQLPGLGLLTFYFGVCYYPTDPSQLSDEATKFHIFHQLKSDYISRKIIASFPLCLQLNALMLQSEFGDFDSLKHKSGYFCEFLLEDLRYEKEIVKLHKKLRGRTPSDVENEFLDRIKWLEFYGVHFTPATYGSESSRCMLGIGPEGVTIYKSKVKIHTHYWTSIAKISFGTDYIRLRAREKPGSSINTYLYSGVGVIETEILFKEMVAHFNFRTLSIRNPLVSSLRQQQVAQKPTNKKSGSKSCSEDIQIRPVYNTFADSMKELKEMANHRDNQERVHGKRIGGYASEPDKFNPYAELQNLESGLYSDRCKRHKHTCRKHASSSYQDLPKENYDCKSNLSLVDRRHNRHQHRSSKRHLGNSSILPPRELAQHFRYIDPIDEGMDLDEIKNIPYTVVRTESSLRKLDRSPSKKSSRTKRTLDWKVPDGEAPPPYLSPTQPLKDASHFAEIESRAAEEDTASFWGSQVLSAIPVNTLHLHRAPIVKTTSVKLKPRDQSSVTMDTNQYMETESQSKFKCENNYMSIASLDKSPTKINMQNYSVARDCESEVNINARFEETRTHLNQRSDKACNHRMRRDNYSDCEVYNRADVRKKTHGSTSACTDIEERKTAHSPRFKQLSDYQKTHAMDSMGQRVVYDNAPRSDYEVLGKIKETNGSNDEEHYYNSALNNALASKDEVYSQNIATTRVPVKTETMQGAIEEMGDLQGGWVRKRNSPPILLNDLQSGNGVSADEYSNKLNGYSRRKSKWLITQI